VAFPWRAWHWLLAERLAIQPWPSRARGGTFYGIDFMSRPPTNSRSDCSWLFEVFQANEVRWPEVVSMGYHSSAPGVAAAISATMMQGSPSPVWR